MDIFYPWILFIYDLKKGLRGIPKNVDQRDTAECSQLGGGVCILDAVKDIFLHTSL